jgi:hypothetical protein
MVPYIIDFIKISSVSCLTTNHRVSEVPMPSYEEVTPRAGSVRSMTGFTEQEFEALRPPVEHAFMASRHDHSLDGQARTVRRDKTYDTCP